MDRNDPDGIMVFCGPVALRKESVDRNKELLNLFANNLRSLSARRAWIEMREKFGLSLLTYRRSPQGERG